MKHTFECGIVGESYDGAGDEFLMGMQLHEAMDRIRKDAADAPGLRREVQHQREVIAALVNRLGGEVTLSYDELWRYWSLNSHEILVMETPGDMGMKIRVRKAK